MLLGNMELKPVVSVVAIKNSSYVNA